MQASTSAPGIRKVEIAMLLLLLVRPPLVLPLLLDNFRESKTCTDPSRSVMAKWDDDPVPQKSKYVALFPEWTPIVPVARSVPERISQRRTVLSSPEVHRQLASVGWNRTRSTGSRWPDITSISLIRPMLAPVDDVAPSTDKIRGLGPPMANHWPVLFQETLRAFSRNQYPAKIIMSTCDCRFDISMQTLHREILYLYRAHYHSTNESTLLYSSTR